MRLLQIHEHLALLQAHGAGPAPPDADADHACLAAAHAIWPETGLSDFHDIVRRVEYVALTGDGRHRLAHVGADHADCFLIVVYDTRARSPTGYLLFDIGAEYRDPVFHCPPAGHHGPATPELIEHWIPRLGQHPTDPIAVLDRGEGTYLCAWQEPDGRYGLEHQLVTQRHCYIARGELDAREVIDAFLSYAFQVKEWTTAVEWERLVDA